MHDDCSGCGRNNPFEKGKDELHVFLQNPECNHVLATCKNCKGVTRIFIIPAAVIEVMNKCKLALRVHEVVSKEVMCLYTRLIGELNAQAKVEEAPSLTAAPPRDWLRALYDDMREFGGES